jgi:tetratricopeptide (TPR) repeat protein
MNYLNRRLALCAFCTIGIFASASEKPWIEVRSEHFRVISDGDVQDVFAIAREFEQMRLVFASGSVNMRLDSGVPLVVFAPRDLQSMGRISSWHPYWEHSSIAGYFQSSWEISFAAVRLDLDQPGYYQPVYHEYVHNLLHMNFKWLPLWLDEGLAELYGTSRFNGSSALVGVPSPRKFVMDNQDLIPLKTLFAVDPSSAYYHGPKTQLFYAESWALAHYLTFGEGMEQGKRMGKFYNLLESGTDQEKAFEQVFGPIKEIEDDLGKYARKGRMHAWEIKSFPQIPTHTLASRTLSAAEAEAELGRFSLWVSHDMVTARNLIEKALKDDPKLGLAHENMGFLNFADGKDEDALREFTAAVECDHTRYLSLFYSTMLSRMAQSSVPADQAQFENALFKTLQLNPQFAQVYIQLALLYARQGDLKKALAAATKAGHLEPSRAGYDLLAGSLLLQMGRGRDAAATAKYVAERWHDVDREEALELWNKVPQGQRPAETLVADKEPEDVKKLEGTVASVECKDDGKERSLTMTVQSSGQAWTFRENAHGMKMGFSDTLWYGRDHFSLCHHVDGMRAIVKYKATSDKGYAGELYELQLRVDAPVTPMSSTTDHVGYRLTIKWTARLGRAESHVMFHDPFTIR